MSEPNQFDLDWSARRRDDGIARALTHAESVRMGWNMAADELLLRFLGTVQGGFLAEQFVAYAEKGAFPPPPDARAWGGVIRRAAIAGIIRRVGYKLDKYASPK